MTDEQIKELFRGVNRVVLDEDPERFQRISQLANEGLERAQDCLSINYGMNNLALDFGMKWAFDEVVKDPLAYFYNGTEYLDFLCDYAEKDYAAVAHIFASFGEDEWKVILTNASPKQRAASRCIALHFADLSETDRQQAFPFLQEAAAHDMPEAFDAMAFCLVEAFCTDYDLEQARTLHRRAEEAGLVMEPLGVAAKIATKDEEIAAVMAQAAEADATKANQLYEEAAEMGSQEAKQLLNADYYFNLAIACRDGKDVEKNPNLAYRYFKEAAKQNHLQALYEMGVCKAEGRGTYKNWEKGLALIQQAADAGNPEAQTYLAEKDKIWNKIKRAF